MNEFTVTTIGGDGSGKTSLQLRFVQGVFMDAPDSCDSVGVRKQLEVDTERSILAFDEITSRCTDPRVEWRQCRMSGEQVGFLLVYAINSAESFDEIISLRAELEKARGSTPFPHVLVGTKVDLEEERMIARADGQALADTFRCPFFETSAKSGLAVDDSYVELVRAMQAFAEARREQRKGERTKKCVVT